MAIEPFRRRVGIPNAAPLVPVRTVNIPDIGRQISSAGQAIFQAGEQERIAKAQEAGRAAAATAVIRDEQGNLVSEMPETTGGIYKQQAYQQALEANYISQFSYDIQKSLDDLVADPQYFNDPDELRRAGEAHIQGRLAVIPEEFRTQAQAIALREGEQRFFTAVNETRRRNENSIAAGVIKRIENSGRELEDSFMTGVNVSEQERTAITARHLEDIQSLKDIGASDVEILERFKEVGLNIKDLRQYTDSLENVSPINNAIGSLGYNRIDDLRIVLNWAAGSPTDETISLNIDGQDVQLTYNELRRRLPDDTVLGNLGRFASRKIQDLRGIESERLATLRAQEAAAREEQRHQEIIRVLSGDDAANGLLTGDAKAVAEEGFATAVNAAGGLGTASGNAIALEYLTQYPLVPNSMKAWITSNLRNPNTFASALDLYNGLDNLTTKTGANMGDVLVDSLRAEDRALLDVAITLSRSGDPEMIQANMRNLLEKNVYTKAQAVSIYNDENGARAFENNKVDTLREIFNLEEGQVVPADLDSEFDALYTAYFGLYENNAERALQATKEALSSSLVSNPVFFNGIGHRRTIRELGGTNKIFNQILYNRLSQEVWPASHPTLAGQPVMQEYSGEGRTDPNNPLSPVGLITKRPTIGGANSNIRIQALDGNVEGLGRHQITVFDPHNPTRRLGSFVIDFGDDRMKVTAREYLRLLDRREAESVAAAEERRARETRRAEAQRIGELAPGMIIGEALGLNMNGPQE